MFRGWHAFPSTPHFGHRRQGQGWHGGKEEGGKRGRGEEEKQEQKEGRREGGKEEGEKRGGMTEEGRKKKGGRKTGQPKSLMNWQIRRKVSGFLKGWRSSGGHRSHGK